MRRFSGKVRRPMSGEEEKAFTVEECRREDLEEIRRILEDAPEAAMWSEEALGAAIENAVFLVARNANEIMGFILGRSLGNEAEILNLAVKRGFRRKGVGGALVKEMLKQWETKGYTKIFLEVRESNRSGITFYEGLGFRQIGRRPGYYRDPAEAALVLARTGA